MLTILDKTSTPCAAFAPDHTLVWMNQAYEELAGYAAIPSLITEAPTPQDQEKQLTVRVDGRLYIATLLWLTSEEPGYLLVLHPATKHVLGGVKNAQALSKEAFRQQMAHHTQRGVPYSVLWVQFGNLLPGANESDDATTSRVLSALLREQTRSQDIIGDLSGYLYGVLLPNCTFTSAVGRITTKLREAANGSYDKLPEGLRIGAPRVDIGVAIHPHHGQDLETLWLAAEGALALAQMAKQGDTCYPQS